MISLKWLCIYLLRPLIHAVFVFTFSQVRVHNSRVISVYTVWVRLWKDCLSRCSFYVLKLYYLVFRSEHLIYQQLAEGLPKKISYPAPSVLSVSPRSSPADSLLESVVMRARLTHSVMAFWLARVCTDSKGHTFISTPWSRARFASVRVHAIHGKLCLPYIVHNV